MKIDSYIPTRIVFGPGRLEELATIMLPGKKALICVTSDGLMDKLGIQQRVIGLLQKNGVESVVFDQIQPNPTKTSVMNASAMAHDNGCDFVIGLGGGSSIDTAKAAAIMMKNPGDLWDYASVGTGGRKAIKGAAPIVVISTTSGTGTETDPYAVVTNEETNEKLDFTDDANFPTLSFIDPELMVSLPQTLTLYQGFDALFHSSECYINNAKTNRLVDIYAIDCVDKVSKHLPVVFEDGNNIESRGHMAYAADILCGFTQSLVCTTSHHILGQARGGYFANVPHGASLILVAMEYYKKVSPYAPQSFDELGEIMGIKADPANPGAGFVKGLGALMHQTGMDKLTMSEFGIKPEDLPKISDTACNLVGFDCDLQYKVTEQDALEILQKSYK